MDISFEQLATAIAIQLHISHEEAKQLLAAVLEYVEVSAELDVAMNAFLPDYERWLKMRNDSIAKLEELADDLDIHHKNINIANSTGSGIGAAGGVLAIAGAVLSAVTFGLTVPVAATGIAVAVSGGFTLSGAILVEHGITKHHRSNAQKIYDNDMKQTEQIVQSLNEISKLTKKLEAIHAVLEEFDFDVSDGSDVEYQTEHQAMFLPEEGSVGPSADVTVTVECLARQDKVGTQIESQGAGDDMSRVVRSDGGWLGCTRDERESQKLMALKSSGSTTDIVCRTKYKTPIERGESSGSATLEAAMAGAAVVEVGAIVIGTYRSQQKLMIGVGKAGKSTLPKLAENMGKVRRIAKLAGM